MTDKRYKVGIWVTGLYLLALLIYTYLQRHAVLAMEPNELGDALAGAASPLAFLWLVLGYLQQGDELRQNTEALKLQASELRNAVEQQRAMAEAARTQIEDGRQHRAEQYIRQVKAAQPRFGFSVKKIDEAAEPAFDLFLRNHGVECSALRLRVPAESGLLVEPASRLRLAKAHGLKVKISVVEPDKLFGQVALSIRYRDANAELQSQEVDLLFERHADGSYSMKATQMDWEEWMADHAP